MKRSYQYVCVDVKVNLMKPSAFDNPTWVTAEETDLEIGLIEGKDYKVVKVEEDRYWIMNKYQSPNPVWYRKDRFDKITPADVLQKKEPTPCEEVGTDGFEDLVYVEPRRGYHIQIDSLTDEQKNFLIYNLTWFDEDRFDKEFVDLCYCKVGNEWFSITHSSDSQKISFNDIFVHKSQLEENK
ncbi:hypothetical protein NVP1101O_038 [Vibrio phage 1.101.O._10N.261.45.C6]|nr:hypothetical protein NVP1101O_038 [Vibrio phage 1.101.O._10N.261.45.C6]